ncbi:hypothetical protein CRG98_049713, partial [Punica granatum]
MVALSHENSAPDAAVFLSKLTGNKAEMQGGSGSSNYGGQIGGRGGTSKTCYHCGRPGHLKNSCWLLHGFPGTWDSKKEKGKLGFAGKRIGETMAGQQRTGLGSGQFRGLKAHQTQIGSFNPGSGQF